MVRFGTPLNAYSLIRPPVSGCDIRIDVPVAERGRAEHAGLLREVHRRLWSLIRDEAATADREIQHV